LLVFLNIRLFANYIIYKTLIKTKTPLNGGVFV